MASLQFLDFVLPCSYLTPLLVSPTCSDKVVKKCQITTRYAIVQYNYQLLKIYLQCPMQVGTQLILYLCLDQQRRRSSIPTILLTLQLRALKNFFQDLLLLSIPMLGYHLSTCWLPLLLLHYGRIFQISSKNCKNKLTLSQ